MWIRSRTDIREPETKTFLLLHGKYQIMLYPTTEEAIRHAAREELIDSWLTPPIFVLVPIDGGKPLENHNVKPLDQSMRYID